jgi:hypothetical protein
MNLECILYGIEYADLDEAREIGKALQARFAEIRRSDPFAYVIKRTLKDGRIRYLTEEAMGGWCQTLAENLDWWSLRVFSYRTAAETVLGGLQGRRLSQHRGDAYEIVAVEKAELRLLSCWMRLKDRPDFQKGAPKKCTPSK